MSKRKDVTFQVRLTREHAELIRASASKLGLSVSEWLCYASTDALANLQKPASKNEGLLDVFRCQADRIDGIEKIRKNKKCSTIQAIQEYDKT